MRRYQGGGAWTVVLLVHVPIILGEGGGMGIIGFAETGRALGRTEERTGIAGRGHGLGDGDDLAVLRDDKLGFTGFDGPKVFGAVGFEVRDRDFLLLNEGRLHLLQIKLTIEMVNY